MQHRKYVLEVKGGFAIFDTAKCKGRVFFDDRRGARDIDPQKDAKAVKMIVTNGDRCPSADREDT